MIPAASTLAQLHGAIKARLAVVAAAFPLLETKTANSPRPPSVIDGWVPPKVTDVEMFPFMIVRPSEGSDSEQGADENATARIDIVIGTYSDTDDGWLDVMLLIDAIRNDFGSAPAIDDTAFEQTGPLTWAIPEAQPRPQWFGTVKTIWTLPRPRRVEARNPEEG